MTYLSLLKSDSAQKQHMDAGTSGERQNPPYNVAFGILSALAILMIVAGHLGYDIFTVGGLFPYYSFHVPLFMFISGYFYRDAEEGNPLAYLKKKAKRLLLPYFFWNVVYGLLAAALRAFGGFSMGEAVSLKTLFFTPFLNGYQFILNYAAWFVPVLFIVEVMNLCMRLLLGRLHINSEWLILAGTLAVGMLVVQFAIEGRVWGTAGYAWQCALLCRCAGGAGAAASVLQRACLQQRVVYGLCQRAGDSICDSGVGNCLLAAGVENSGAVLRGKTK